MSSTLRTSLGVLFLAVVWACAAASQPEPQPAPTTAPTASATGTAAPCATPPASSPSSIDDGRCPVEVGDDEDLLGDE